MSNSRPPISRYELFNLMADDKEYLSSRRRNRVVAAPAPAPATAQQVAVQAAAAPAKKKKRNRKTKLAKEPGTFYGLPADLLRDQEEQSRAPSTPQGVKRERDAAEEVQVNATPATDMAAAAAINEQQAVAMPEDPQNKKQDIKPEAPLPSSYLDLLKKIQSTGDLDALPNTPSANPAPESAASSTPGVASTLEALPLPSVISFEEYAELELLERSEPESFYGEYDGYLPDAPIMLEDFTANQVPLENLSTRDTIFSATLSGDVNRVITVLDRNPKSILEKDSRGNSSYDIALYYGLTEVAKILKQADTMVILDIMGSVYEKPDFIEELGLNASVKQAEATKKAAPTTTKRPDPAVKDDVKVHQQSVFKKPRNTKNSNKAVEADAAEQADNLQAIKQDLAKVAVLQFAANKALHKAVSRLDKAQSKKKSTPRKRR